MSTSADRLIANMDGAAALPRKNGELVFAAPWEGRAFGMAVALSEARRCEWEDFRQRLIAEIAAHEAHHEPHADNAHADEPHYYAQWLAALERLLVERGLLAAEEIEARTTAYAAGERDEVF